MNVYYAYTYQAIQSQILRLKTAYILTGVLKIHKDRVYIKTQIEFLSLVYFLDYSKTESKFIYCSFLLQELNDGIY